MKALRRRIARWLLPGLAEELNAEAGELVEYLTILNKAYQQGFHLRVHRKDAHGQVKRLIALSRSRGVLRPILQVAEHFFLELVPIEAGQHGAEAVEKGLEDKAH